MALITQIGLSLLLLSKTIVAQGTDPLGGTPFDPETDITCVEGWHLLLDSPRNPCGELVHVMTQCAGSFQLNNVSTEALNLYPVPSGNTTRCECNEVAYNLFQACTACQLGTDVILSKRQMWFANCPDPASPPVQPPGADETTFWVTQVYNPAFDVDIALQVALTHQPPNSTADSSSGSDAEPTLSSASSSSSRGMSHTGAIIGGAIGGAALLAILIVVIFFLMRRKRSRTAPSKEFMQYAPVNQAIIPPQHGVDEETGSLVQNSAQRHSAALRQDSGVTEEMEALPGFTPGLFKDPIFEKGAALNIVNNASASPVTYSPATPSTTFHTYEGQRLIQSRQASSS